MVRDLIDPVYKVWNEDVIDRTFFAFEVTTIKNIPIYRSIQDNVLLWPFNPDGVYTVKFGYRFLYDKQCKKQPSPSEVEVLKPLWNKIWGLHVPNKIKRLAWKAYKNALPIKLNLVHHKIIMDGCCDACKTQQEDAVHALFLCPDLRPLWSSMPKWNHGTLRPCTSFIDIFDCIFASNKDLDLFAAVIWTLWTRRNNLRPSKSALSLNKVIEFARERLTEVAMGTSLFSYSTTGAHDHNLNSDGATAIEDTATTNALPSPYAQHTPTTWMAPGAHSYKLNFDGATFVEEDTAGIGVVIHNDAGLVMASLSQRIPLPASVIKVEAFAEIRAMEIALELGFDNVTLEGDSKVPVKTLNDGGNTLAHYGNLTVDILFVTSHFSKVQFSFVRRQYNRLAHSLARHASMIQQMSIWMEEVPPDLIPVFLADLHSLP